MRAFGLLVLDFKLPDGTGMDVLRELANADVFPANVAVSGEVGPEESFQLAQRGVRCFLRKPFGFREINAAIEQALHERPDSTPMLRSAVGHQPIKEFEGDVRRTMVAEALARTNGSIRAAAALLGISRQLLSHIVRNDR